MGILNDIDFAIVETLKAHPDFIPDISTIYLDNLTSKNGIYLKNFTSRNNARQKMKSVTQTDMLRFVLEEAVKCYNAMTFFYYNDPNMLALQTTAEKMANITNTFPYYGVCLHAVEIIANPCINAAIYYQSDNKELMALVTAVMNTRYQCDEKLRTYIDRAGQGFTYLDSVGHKDLFTKIENDIEKAEVAKNIRINPRGMNQCLHEVLNGSQLKHKHNEYGLGGTLFATQDIGKKRNNQEDSVLILEHPENKEFKLLAVADGMGGVELGDKASAYTVKELARWFNSLPADLYYFPSEVQQQLNKKIAQISNEIYKEYNADYRYPRCGSTLATSIVTQEYTINSSVGDSRIYTIKDNQLQLITRDESAVWPPAVSAKEMKDKDLDDLRFVRNNNEILTFVGLEKEASYIQTNMIPNKSYDRLLIFSDGVTDLLSQNEIYVIARTYPIEKITHQLVQAAISKNAIRPEGEDYRHYAALAAGKDNATAAMYVRR